jgi:3-oxoacyl-[acyl-carrier protein] reductase
VPNNASDRTLSPVRIPDLSGKRVLITGASSGIGSAMARAFGANQAAVAVHYNSDRTGAGAVVAAVLEQGGKAVSLAADLTEAAAADRLVLEAALALGGLDIVINNAGGPVGLVPVATMTDEHFDRVFNLNARSVFATCRAAIPHLRKGGAGSSIINVTSLSARLGGSVGAGLYAASKAFVGALTRNLARELAPDGIRVNALSSRWHQPAVPHIFMDSTNPTRTAWFCRGLRGGGTVSRLDRPVRVCDRSSDRSEWRAVYGRMIPKDHSTRRMIASISTVILLESDPIPMTGRACQP